MEITNRQELDQEEEEQRQELDQLNNLDSDQEPGPSESLLPKKRRRAISPNIRVQKPRVSMEEGLRALTSLSIEQQQMIEREARIGISGTQVIHWYV